MTIQLSVVDISGIESYDLWSAEMHRLYDKVGPMLKMLNPPGPAGVFLVAAQKGVLRD